jgi:hypothetical protein
VLGIGPLLVNLGIHFLLTDSTAVEMQGSRLVPCVCFGVGEVQTYGWYVTHELLRAYVRVGCFVD